jgi:curved DNA-binding protein CbpA
VNYQETLEFIGEVRAGISWERFCLKAVRHSDVFINILNDSDESREFLSSAGISREYVSGQITGILSRLHFNKENDHYLTLALSRSASESQLHKRWKELMLLYHPDRNSGDDAVACAMKINDAYSVLRNPQKKAEYDRKLLSQREGLAPGPEISKFRTPPIEDVLVSPRTRTILSKLVIPFCVVVASVILLVIFLENRERGHSHHAAVTDKGDGHLQSPAVGPRPEKTAEPGGDQPDNSSARETASPVPYPENPPAGKERTSSVPTVTKTNPPPVRAELPRREQATVAQGPLVIEKRKPAASERTGKTSSEVRAVAETASKKKEPERRDPVDGETPLRNPPYRLQETSDKDVRAVPVPSPQVMARVEPEDMDRWVNSFISQYARAYEEGDIEKFMSFFSKSAVENGKMNYDEIRKAYKRNFESFRCRYTLRNVQSGKNGDDIIVAAAYIINKSPDAAGEPLVQGDIRWTLIREGGALKILKVDYASR